MPSNRPALQAVINACHLQPLPVEGGLFRETYRSADVLSPGVLGDASRYGGQEKPCATAILYLLTGQPGSFSALHRLPTDEIWHFYLGDPLEMTLLFPDGSSKQVILGQDILNGEQVQVVVPRGVWQGTRLKLGGEYALVGTTMAPGFTPDDYEGGDRSALSAQYPQVREQIIALTRTGRPA